MSDQTTDNGEVVVSPSRGMEDYFGEMPEAPADANDQTDTAKVEEVKSDQTDTKKTGEDDTKENDSESKKEESDKKDDSKTEDKKTTETKKEDGKDDPKKSEKSDKDKKDNKDAQPEEFEVAGTKYSTYNEAVKAVNRINGDNTRLSGDVKSLRKEKLELGTNVSKLEGLLKDYKKANAEWQKYYDGDGEKPDDTKANLEELIDKKVKEVKNSEKEIEMKVQADAEFDEIFAEKDFEKVEPFFKELVDSYEGVKNPPSPKKLYKRAKADYKESLGDNELKDLDSIEEMVNERVQKELKKREAALNNSDAGGAGEDVEEKKLPPEVADYMAQYM